MKVPTSGMGNKRCCSLPKLSGRQEVPHSAEFGGSQEVTQTVESASCHTYMEMSNLSKATIQLQASYSLSV